MYSIRIHEVRNPEEWNKTLSDFQSSVFITDLWLQGVKRANAIPIYLDFTSNGETVAKIAGLTCRNPENKIDILYFYSGIAFRTVDPDLIQSCYQQLIQFAKRQKFDKLIVESVDYFEEFNIPIKGLAISRRRSEYILDLVSEEDLFYGKLNKTLRKNIRRAKRKGSVVIESKSGEILNRLIEYLEITRRIRISKGYGSYNYLPMKNLNRRALKLYLNTGLATMFYVTTNDEINCILYVLLHEKRPFFFLVGTTEEGYKSYSPVFIYYNTMNTLIERGFSTCNLGGIPAEPSSQPGLIYLKKSLGAHESKLLNYKTYFLKYPLKMLNPLMYIYDQLPDNRITRAVREKIRRRLN